MVFFEKINEISRRWNLRWNKRSPTKNSSEWTYLFYENEIHQNPWEVDIKSKMKLGLWKNQKVIKNDKDELIIKTYHKNKKQPIQQQPMLIPPDCPSCERSIWLKFDKGY